MSETYAVSISVSLTVRGRFTNVKHLEEAVQQQVQQAAQQFYAQAVAAYQRQWLAAHRERYQSVRWRQRQLLSPWGELALPVLMVRERGRFRGGYHSLGKVLWRGKATRLRLWQPLHHFSEPISGEVRSQGFNTDSDGVARALREDLAVKLEGAKVLLLGTGGAGQVAALRLAQENVSELFLVEFVSAKAEAVAQEIRKRYPKVKVALGFPPGPVDLLLNATPLGLKPGDPLPLDEKQFPLRQARAVYDMIYNPAETPLLKAAKTAGCRTANGLGMLLHQGAKAFEIWTRQSAPLDVMRRALEAEVYQSTVHSR